MMASACVNNVTLPPESFPPASQSSYGVLRTNISPTTVDVVVANTSHSAVSTVDSSRSSADLIDFEFHLDDPVAMLPADELFSDGKLVPLHLTTLRTSEGENHSTGSDGKLWCGTEVGSNELVFSPKAPRCTTRWRELLGFKKLQNPKMLSDQSKPAYSPEAATPGIIEPIPVAKSPRGKSFRHLLLNYSKSSIDPSLSLPLLHDSEAESVTSSISTRLSISSTSSGLDHEDLPRLSRSGGRRNPAALVPARGVSVDSPRMDPSGRIIFQGLERSSSSPGSFNGRPRTKFRGMERSFSAHVRVPSVLNVPVCSLRRSSKPVSLFGFGQLFSHPRKDRVSSSSSRAAMQAGGRR
ncbi:uncharacterized protein LOC110038063 [Phalaenopsis equestris]|uniref:uncharacterized protein LOC110038063 n=1 Tax=Phalaenopsis equestris TaxID=78828 RepID=UPI0009E62DF5|nr:uncharacterized protein LOC110038063 [Phalaenopsis equestris]